MRFILILTLQLVPALLLEAQWSASPFSYSSENIEAKAHNKYQIPDSKEKVVVKARVENKRSKEKNKRKLASEAAGSEYFYQEELKEKGKIESKEARGDNSGSSSGSDSNWEMLKEEFNDKQKKETAFLMIESPKRKASLLKINLQLFDRSFQAKSQYFPREMSFNSLGIGLTGLIKTSKSSSAVISYESNLPANTKDSVDGLSLTEVDLVRVFLGGEFLLGSIDTASENYFRIGFRETSLEVPKSADYKLSYKSSGLDFAFGSRSKNLDYSLGLEAGFQLLNSHKEENSSWTAKSGSAPKSQAIYFKAFYEKPVTESLLWRYFIEINREHIQFSRETEADDPKSATTIQNTQVDIQINTIGIELNWSY